MESPNHSLNMLFEQLGLEHGDEAIDKFISSHKLTGGVLLHEAGIWNKAQSAFLKEAVDDDADWAMVVNQLDSMLR